MSDSDKIALAGTCVNALIAVITMVTLFFLYRQTREATRSRQLQVMQNIFNDFGSEENRQLRYFIYTQLPALPPDQYSRDAANNIERVCNSVDQLGFLVNNKLVERDKLFQFYGYTIVNCWDKCEAYVLHIRAQRSKYYWADFESIHKDARTFMNKRS